MRSVYKSPVIWIIVVIGILTAIAGEILTTAIQSNWKYLFSNWKAGGLMIAGYFTLCALVNFIGTRCKPVERQGFTQHYPATLVAIIGCFSVIALIGVIITGIDHSLGLGLLISAFGVTFLGIPIAFFLRGRTVPTIHDR